MEKRDSNGFCKIQKVLRLSLFFSLLALLFLLISMEASASTLIYEQKYNLNLSLKNEKTEKALDEISRQSGIKIAYSNAHIPIGTVITLKIKTSNIEDALRAVLGNDYTFKQVEDYIAIAHKEKTIDATTTSQNDKRKLNGLITDEDGNPVIGASISIEGTILGVLSDMDGKYEIMISTGDVLDFRYIGYNSEKRKIKNETTLNIRFIESSISLEDVVVVGYGSQKKQSLVGAQAAVKPGELSLPTGNITNSLTGRLAGVIGMQRSGEPGRDQADIWIRGIGTMGNSNKPLVLIDGVERDLNVIDPQDIASFAILKDASATAVYGVRGANGVILVKTKTGTPGKMSFNVNATSGITQMTQLPKMLDGVRYMQLYNEGYLASGHTDKKYSDEIIELTRLGIDPIAFPNTDWMSELFNDFGFNNRINMSASGGSEKVNYYTSVSIYNEKGLLKTDGLEKYNVDTRYTRYNFTGNLSLALTNTTKFDLGTQGYVSYSNYPPNSSADGAIGSVYEIPPTMYPVMYPGGLVPGKENSDHGKKNPYAQMSQSGYTNRFDNQISSNARITQDFGCVSVLKGLSLTAMFSFDALNSYTQSRMKNPDTYYISPLDPYNEDGSYKMNKVYSGSNTLAFSRSLNDARNSYYFEAAINYNRTFEDHSVSGLLLFNRGSRTNALEDNLIGSLPFRHQGYAGRGTYAYKSKYLAEFNFGYNGSENFAPDKRYGFFPSVGLGWILSEESFFEPFKNIVQYLKFRYSDGLVGSSDVAQRFAYMSYVDGAGGYIFGQDRSVIVDGLNVGNYGSDVTWSISRKRDLGVEFKLFGNRLYFMVDLFKEHRTGIFLQRQTVADFSGFYRKQPYGNVGIVDNKGLELTFETGEPIKIGKTTWDLRGNLTYSKDKIIEDDKPVNPKTPNRDKRGYNVNGVWGLIADGLWTEEEVALSLAAEKEALANNGVYPENNIPKGTWNIRAGDIKYVDVSGDGRINDDDLSYISRGDIPSLVYGFGFNMIWKGFNVSAFFQGVGGVEKELQYQLTNPFGQDGQWPLFEEQTNRWTKENPNQQVLYPRLGVGSDINANNNRGSSWWIRDLNFVRLKTAEVGYAIPANLLRDYHIQNARIYVQGLNLLTFSKFNLWDPELNAGNGGRHPLLKTFSVGLQVTLF